MRLASIASVLATVALLLPTRSAIAQRYSETDLVSDVPGRAAIRDSNLVNPWGLVPGSSGVFWTSNNGTGTSTLYRPNGTKVPLTVTVPEGGNTGVALANPADPGLRFTFPSGDTTAAAIFIFVSERGTISAWNNTVDPNNAIQVANKDGASYKGLALASTGAGPRLYAANFHLGTIDVFDGTFQPVATSGHFTDPSLPAGYAPFNIANINDRLYVAFAQQDADSADEVAGPGLGFIDVFDTDGQFVRRLTSSGSLNAPWAMVAAPPGFGAFGGALLVGNFGDGRINAFSFGSGSLQGTLQDSTGAPLSIDGLWGLHFGLPVSGPDVANRLYFAAGFGDEAHGLFGFLAPIASAAVACDGESRGVGFWRKACSLSGDDQGDDEGGKGKGDGHGKGGPHGVSSDSLNALFSCVGTASQAFGSSGCFTAGCNLFAEHGHLPARERVAQNLLVLMVNRCAGLTCDSTAVACGGDLHTVGEVIAAVDRGLCANDASIEELGRLAKCALGSAEDDGDDDGTRGGDDSHTTLDILPLGGNPVRLASGLGARFLVSTRTPATIRFRVYDATGRLVAEPLSDVAVTGSTVVHWNGLDLRGAPAPSGTYFYRGVAGSAKAGGRIVVLR